MNVTHLPYSIEPEHNRNHYYEILWKKEALALLAKHVPSLKGKSLLDYGCGRGETMELAKNYGMEVTGTDLDPECVRLSSAFGPCQVLDPEHPARQFGENSFDFLACFHVLEHVPRPLETVLELKSIARSHLILAVPNLSRPHDMIRRRNWDTPVNEGHLQSWDHSHFRNLIERHAGMKIVAWAHDAVVIPPLSNIIERIGGPKAAIAVETGLFKRLLPYGSISIIALVDVQK